MWNDFTQGLTGFLESAWVFLLNASAPVLFYGYGLAIGVAVAIVYAVFKFLQATVPDENREFMDPLPPLLKHIL